MNSPARRVALASIVAFALAAFAVVSPRAAAQCISLALNTAATQSFDMLATSGTSSTLPAGWAFAESGTNANTLYTAGTGSANAGDTYSFGADGSTERAFGGLQSGSLVPTIGACFTNNTGGTLTNLEIAYVGEQWRLGATGRTDRIDFQYSTGATSLTTGTWTDVNALDFSGLVSTGAVGALNGNSTAYRATVASTITGLSIANGANFWIRWTDFNATSSDDGLAVDDFSLTARTAADSAPVVSSVTPAHGSTGFLLSSPLSVTFSESVNAAAGAFNLACPAGTAVAFTVSSGPSATYTLTPSSPLPEGTVCTWGVAAASVTDADANDPPDALPASYAWSFTTWQRPTLTVNDVTVTEGNAGTVNAVFTVSLSAAAPAGGVTFDIATADGTATTAGNDYVAKTVTGQTIAAGGTSATFTVVVNGDTTLEGNEIFYANVTNVTGAIVGDAQGRGTITNDDYSPLTPIHAIQGPGATSPLVGQVVATSGIVTGIRYNDGFFIQEPDVSVDADPLTSEGIFVYTGSVPPAAAVVGALVNVAGVVSEYAPGYLSVTELTYPNVSQVSAGNPLPAATTLTATFPSPTGPYDQLEPLEGMRVQVDSMTVVTPTSGGTSSNYTSGTSDGIFFGVVSGLARPFREAGFKFPLAPPAGTTIPQWDANPELIRVDSYGLVGATKLSLSSRSVITNVVGPLDYDWGRYTILPSVTPTVPGEFPPTAVLAPTANEFTVASYNLQRFFDNVDDPNLSEPILTSTQWNARLAKASVGIRDYAQTPDILGVIEVENLATLQALAAKINADAGAASPQYVAYLEEGNDIGGIDVGFLVRNAPAGARPHVEVVSVTQELGASVLHNPDGTTSLLHDRPPLMLRAIVRHQDGRSYPITVIENHLRSLSGIDSEDDDNDPDVGWGTVGNRVRAKRLAQAEDLARFVQARQLADPTERIVVMGDMNAFEVNDGYVHTMATLAGTAYADSSTVVPGDGADLLTPDLLNLLATAPAEERYGYTFDESPQNLDHMLVDAALVAATPAFRLEHARINADFPDIDRSSTTVRLSDHDPLVGFFAFPAAGVSVGIVDSPDPVSQDAGLTYSIVVTNTGADPATGLTLTDTVPAGTVFSSLAAPGGWTCSTPAVGATGTVTCSSASLAAGASVTFTFTVRVGASVATGTVITDTVSVTQTSADANPADNTASASTTVQSPFLVTASKVAAGPAAAGGLFDYTVTLRNHGAVAQTDNPGNEFVDVLPSSLAVVSASATSGTATTDGATNAAIWNGGIPAGGTVTITVTARVLPSVAEGELISNQGTVSFDSNGDGANDTSLPTDDPATATVGDATVVAAAAPATGPATIPTLDTLGLGLLALLMAIGGAFVLARRLS